MIKLWYVRVIIVITFPVWLPILIAGFFGYAIGFIIFLIFLGPIEFIITGKMERFDRISLKALGLKE